MRGSSAPPTKAYQSLTDFSSPSSEFPAGLSDNSAGDGATHLFDLSTFNRTCVQTSERIELACQLERAIGFRNESFQARDSRRRRGGVDQLVKSDLIGQSGLQAVSGLVRKTTWGHEGGGTRSVRIERRRGLTLMTTAPEASESTF